MTRSHSPIPGLGGLFVGLKRPLAALAVALSIAAGLVGAAHAETRTLRIYHLHTHERAEIAFKKDGRYLPEGLKQLNYILRDWRRNEPTRMDPRLFDLIWAVYQKSGSHDYINVVCGYRAPETNSMLRHRSRGVAEKSQHMLGRAMDFFIPGVPLEKLREIGLKMQVGGVGYYPTSGSPFVHMDVGNPRHWPRMSRRQLLALFPGGKTLYLPSDGGPLPGYEQAVAEYKARRGSAPDIQIASATKHRGFFAALFGGGSDESEDNSDSDVAVASAAPVPAKGVKKPATATALPGVDADSTVIASNRTGQQADDDQPATIVAGLPPKDVPLPDKAPRPELGIGTADDQAAQPEAEVAMNVPLPSKRPDFTPAATEQASATDQVAAVAAVQTADASADIPATGPAEITALLAREGGRMDESDDSADQADQPATLAAFAGPLPSARPDPADRSLTVAALPSVRPDYEQSAPLVPAVYTTDDDAPAKGGRLSATKVSASQRLALLSRQDGVSATAAIASGVRTTEKESRRMAGGKARPKAMAVAIPGDVARWALHKGAFAPPITTRVAPALAYNMVRKPPRTVYTAGFMQGDAGQDTSHFTGSAVTFLSVAKFDGPDAATN